MTGKSWTSWNAATGTPGPVHGPRRDRPDGSKDVPWPAGTKLADLIYIAGGEPPPDDTEVVLTEGEKAADAVFEAGFRAVATVCGAAAQPGPAVISFLAGFRLTLSPDNDEPGEQHMRRIAGELERAGLSALRWLDPPADAPEHWDLADADEFQRAELVIGARFLQGFGLGAQTHSGTGDTPAAGIEFRTARDLFAALPAETEWWWTGYGAVGTIIELDGRAKAAGKSTFAAHLQRAVLDGTPFLGRPTRRSPVILLSEQPVASLRATLAPAGLLERTDMLVLPYGDTIGRPWSEVAAAAVDQATRLDALLVVDTLPQWAGLRGDAENSSGAALEAIEPLQRATAAGVSVVVVRHDRKGPSEVGESARGSTAFGAAVDVILQLRRGSAEERSTVRYLSALSRFAETPTELVVDLTPDGYVALGDGIGYARSEGKQRILAALDGVELKRAEIEELANVSGERLTELLAELVETGFLAREGRGVRGDPQRFRRVIPIHSGTPSHYVRGAVTNGIEPGASPMPLGMSVSDEMAEIFAAEPSEPDEVDAAVAVAFPDGWVQ